MVLRTASRSVSRPSSVCTSAAFRSWLMPMQQTDYNSQIAMDFIFREYRIGFELGSEFLLENVETRPINSFKVAKKLI